MADANVIIETLEEVGETCPDPTPLVYDRLFAQRPDLEVLFVMDKDGGVRGSMMQQCLECIIDQVGEKSFVEGILISERQRHESYGVEEDVFETFFPVIRDTFRDHLGARWTPEMDREWSKLVDELLAIS